MAQTESAPASASARTRVPHVMGVIAGVTILAASVLLWTAGPEDQDTSGQTALGSTLSLGTPGESVVRQAVADSATVNPAPKLPESTPASPIKSEDTTIADKSTVTNNHVAILGTWKQYSHGHRLLNVHEGGKATIDVKLDGLSALAFGEKMRFDIEWTIEGDTLKFKTTGGTPKASVDAVNSVYGDHRVYQILEINEKQMLLQEGDEKKTPWDRVLIEGEAKP